MKIILTLNRELPFVYLLSLDMKCFFKIYYWHVQYHVKD